MSLYGTHLANEYRIVVPTSPLVPSTPRATPTGAQWWLGQATDEQNESGRVLSRPGCALFSDQLLAPQKDSIAH
jgi:hypothetical protein